jgi:hypothetical protein
MRIFFKTIIVPAIAALALGTYTLAAQTAAQGTSTTSKSKTKRNRKSTSSAATDTTTPAAPPSAPAETPAATGKSGTAAKAHSEPVNNASDADLSAAKASGKVWVNTSSGTYHKGGRYYGKTKQGKFMTEDEAKKAGYHEAKREIGAKKG